MDLIPAVDEARAAGVLAESGSALGFRHPLIRAALYEEIPAPVRAAWHCEAGPTLARAGAPADRVARQLLQAVRGPADTTEPMDEWIVHWLDRTAPLLVGQAPGAAAELSASRSRGHRLTHRSMTACSACSPRRCTGSAIR